MRILHVTDGYRPRLGGIEIFVEDLAGRQACAGHEVSVLTASREDAAEPALRAGPADPVRVVRTPPTLRHPLLPGLARETALAGPYDVVHAHLSVVSPFATTVARLTDEAGIATVNTVHSMWGSRRPIVRAIRALADWDHSTVAWTAVSHAAAADVSAVLHPDTGVRVVPNAVDVDWWRARTPVRAPGAPVTLVTVMRIAGRKRPLPLVAMLQRLRTQVPADVGLRALVIGDGPLERRMQTEIEARGLNGWVTMLGRRTREEIRDVYATADVYVSPAHEESFGIAALEARAAGLPVVAMQSGGVGEFVEHGIEGLLCRDDEDMATALATLSSRPTLRGAMLSHNAVHRPRQDWSHALAAFDDVYGQALMRQDLLRRESSRPVPDTANPA